MKKSSENDLKRAVLEYLEVRGIWAWRQNAGAVISEYKGKKRFFKFSTQKGISDILGVLNDGRILAIECKVKPNKPTVEQLEFLGNVKRRGGVACLCWNLEDVSEAINEGRE